MQTVQPRFRVDVFIPDDDDPVFTSGRCRVPTCQRPLHFATPGLCDGHRKAWDTAGRPPLAEWATRQTELSYDNASFSACLVIGCNRARGHLGLCARHRHGWKCDGRPDPRQWAARTPYVPPTQGERDCRFIGCERWADLKDGFCSSHYARWKKAGKPEDIAAFSQISVSRGRPRLDMRELSPQIRLELGLGLQRRAETQDRKTCLRPLANAVTWVRQTGVHSLLDLDEAAWRAVAVGPSGARPTNTALTFVLDTRYHLEVLLAGGVWEREYDRDVWDLRRFARAPENTARYLRFSMISQQWVRELAKRWARRMISTNTASTTIAAQVRYLGEFAQYAARRPDGCRAPEQLTRELLETWFAWMQAEGIHVSTRKRKISALSVFLDCVHTLGWEERLPRTTVVVTGDGPKALPSRPRFLSEVVMRQCEDDTNLARFPTRYGELLLRIVMACGLRSKDAAWLPFDCVVRDNTRAPYLAWINHKVGQRMAFFPITEKLAARIAEQQDRVRAGFPGGCSLLFPAETDNPRGDKPVPRKTWVGHLTAWLADVDVVDEHGHRVHVTPHQFRHTLGTRLINADVPQHVVQELMDHMSAAMTAVYARLHATTIREHWERAVVTVNAQGEIVQLDQSDPLSNAAWTRISLGRAKQTLPNGYCGLPLVRDCEHANPCLTCPMFLTTPEFLPQHREQRVRTLTIIDTARTAGHDRIAEKNTTILNNLDKIINACEGCDDGEVVLGGKVAQLDDAG
jgi:site-specific recombinase XerD